MAELSRRGSTGAGNDADTESSGLQNTYQLIRNYRGYKWE